MQMTMMIGDVKLQSPCMTQWVQRYEVGALQWQRLCQCQCRLTALVARSRYWYGYGCQGSQVGGWAANHEPRESSTEPQIQEPRAKERQLLPCLSNCQCPICPKACPGMQTTLTDVAIIKSKVTQFSAVFVQTLPLRRGFWKGWEISKVVKAGSQLYTPMPVTSPLIAHPLLVATIQTKRKRGYGAQLCKKRPTKVNWEVARVCLFFSFFFF